MATISPPYATEIRARRVTPNDGAAWRAPCRGYATFYERETTEAILDQTWAWLHEPAHSLDGLVAEAEGGTLLGIARHRPQPKPAGNLCRYLHDLFVDPSQRGRGVARS